MDDIWHIIIYFFIYSFAGWLWETAYCSYQERTFIYRGFLFGPYCPIYGFGVLLLLEVLSPLKSDPFLLFVNSIIFMSTLEYATSYVLEKLFHQRWWDYSKEPYNLHGRIALKSSLFWGVMCLVVIYVAHPAVTSFAHWIVSISVLIPTGVALVMLYDAVYTTTRLAGFNKLMAQLHDDLDNSNSEFLAKHIAERIAERRKSGRLRLTERRLIRAFPHATDKRLKNYAVIRTKLLALRKKRTSASSSHSK